jgi:hypothetical protein
VAFDQEQLEWRRADDALGGSVEIAATPDGGCAMRDGKLGDDSPVLWFTEAEWRAFVLGVHNNEFDPH